VAPGAVELVTVVDTDDTFDAKQAHFAALRRRLLPAATAAATIAAVAAVATYHKGVLLQLRVSAADHLAAELVAAKVRACQLAQPRVPPCPAPPPLATRTRHSCY
jgi:hypothetical protein